MDEKYNYIDLFSGIGGFALGAYWAGMKFENHFCSDIEKYCIELYQKRFPNSIQLGDITKIDTQELINKYGTNWILSGGFPCQDISIAGKGEGITGKRSGLWFEYWRLIRDLRPRFAIMENVAAITFRGLTDVVGSLAEIGYNAEWQDISAEEMGANHKRERIWIVAYSDGYGCLYGQNEIYSAERREPSQCNIGTESEMADARLQRQTQYEKQTTGIEQCSQEISDSIEQYDDNPGHGTGEICRERSEKTKIQRCVSDTSIERLEREKSESKFSRKQQGLFAECYAGNWSVEPSVGRLAHGIPRRVDRLKGLGNAIVPQIAELLFRQIKPLL